MENIGKKAQEAKEQALSELTEEVEEVKEKGLVQWFKDLRPGQKFAALAVVLVATALIVAGVSWVF